MKLLRVTLFLVVILLASCLGCNAERRPEQAAVQVRLRSRTVVGEPLSNVLVHTRGAIQREWRTDDSGVVMIESRVSVRGATQGSDETVKHPDGLQVEAGLEIEAQCPDDYVGEAIQRRISPELLSSMVDSPGEWSLELVCLPRHAKLPLGVLSQGCGEVKVTLDGQLLGTTKQGALHSLVDVPPRSSFELSLEAVEKSCQIVEPERQLVLKPGETCLFIRVVSQAVAAPQVRRNHAAQEHTSRRPYRL